MMRRAGEKEEAEEEEDVEEKKTKGGGGVGYKLGDKCKRIYITLPKLCEYSALKYSLPLRLQTTSCPEGLRGPPWPNIHIPLTGTEEEEKREQIKRSYPVELIHLSFIHIVIRAAARSRCNN
ncbi:hypothetical protein F2P81_016662 [Scophthalmus maximus]|uniref:Uncharacterized protein n=1 Tax=Scophthalmus maximus TaxID=52904 RepID=A0A6A4SFS7_SCOMX|nr:hypothetical protein F2P81_016662 [Scophthalmus maximus]